MSETVETGAKLASKGGDRTRPKRKRALWRAIKRGQDWAIQQQQRNQRLDLIETAREKGYSNLQRLLELNKFMVLAMTPPPDLGPGKPFPVPIITPGSDEASQA